MHDLNLPGSINLAFTFSDHLHDILYISETAPRLPGPPIARDIPFACGPVHLAPVNHGTERRPGVDGRAAGDFPVAREGGDRFWDPRVPLPLAVRIINNVAPQSAWMTLSPSSIQAPTIVRNFRENRLIILYTTTNQ